MIVQIQRSQSTNQSQSASASNNSHDRLFPVFDTANRKRCRTDSELDSIYNNNNNHNTAGPNAVVDPTTATENRLWSDMVADEHSAPPQAPAQQKTQSAVKKTNPTPIVIGQYSDAQYAHLINIVKQSAPEGSSRWRQTGNTNRPQIITDIDSKN